MNEMRKLMETVEQLGEEDSESKLKEVLKYFDKDGKVKDGYKVTLAMGFLNRSVDEYDVERVDIYGEHTAEIYTGGRYVKTTQDNFANAKVYKLERVL